MICNASNNSNTQNNKTIDRSIEPGWLIDSPERMLSWGRQADRSSKAAITLRQYIYVQMAASDLVLDEEARQRVDLPEGLLANLGEKNRLLVSAQSSDRSAH